MTRRNEILRLQKQAILSGGYVAKLCKRCGWWQCIEGNNAQFKEDYCQEIRCRCNSCQE